MHIKKHINHGLVLLSLVSFLPFAQAQDNSYAKARSKYGLCSEYCYLPVPQAINDHCGDYVHHTPEREKCSAPYVEQARQCMQSCQK